MKWGWIFPIIIIAGCGTPEEDNQEMNIETSPRSSISNPKRSTKKVPPTYSAAAGRSVAIDSGILLPKREVCSRNDAFALLEDENKIYQELKVEELYQKTDGFLDLVKIPEDEVKQEAKRKILTVPFNRLIGTIISNGIVALVEMNNKKVIEVRPGETIEGWKLNYLDSDSLEFEYMGEGIPKKILLTSKSETKTMKKKEKVLGFGQEELLQEELLNEDQ